MNRQSKKEIQVWADWKGIDGPVKMGTLSSLLSRGKELFSFAYDDRWLNSDHAPMLDPALQLFKGDQFSADERINFGLFLDSAPDRWGRLLQKRREAIDARKEQRKEQSLLESDYLLGVHDEHRMGGLRFKTDDQEGFLANAELASPPFTSLRELESAAWSIENDDVRITPEYEKWVRMLIAPGGSLGGARPKASVVAEDETLWIAKFPSRQDHQDTGLWEFLTHQLAEKCGISVPRARVKVLRGRHHTYLSQRFDRNKKKRIHFASAMTMLGKADGARAEDGTSYLEIAEFLITAGSNVDRDLEQLWRRIVFNMCVSNTDDHLRNHGFLLEEKGWILSPAYDMNPNPESDGLRLNVSESDNSQDLDLAREVAPYFRLTSKQAEDNLKKITSVVSRWQPHAKSLGLSRSQQDEMSRAFRLVQR